MPQAAIKGSNGAGDAFAAGMLLGIHEAWPLDECLKLASATAAASLRSVTTNGAVESWRACLGSPRLGLARGAALMDLTPLYVVLGAAAAGFVQGLSGFAFGLVASAVWAWVVAPQLAGPMVVFGSLLGQILSIGAVRRSFDLRRVLPFVVAGLLGIPIGVVVLKNLDQTIFRLVVGVVLTVYCAAMLLLRNPRPVKAAGASPTRRPASSAASWAASPASPVRRRPSGAPSAVGRRTSSAPSIRASTSSCMRRPSPSTPPPAWSMAGRRGCSRWSHRPW